MPKVDRDLETGKVIRRAVASPLGAQKEALDKLFKRVNVPLDREPTTALGELFGKAKDIGGPRTGSSSAQFHMYRASRRKEYERLEGIEKSAAEEREQEEMEARLRELKQKEDEKTAKNREKRLKKKNKGKAQQQPEQQHADAVPIVVPAKESKKEETSSTNKVDTKAQVEQPSHAIVRPDTIKIIDEDSF